MLALPPAIRSAGEATAPPCAAERLAGEETWPPPPLLRRLPLPASSSFLPSPPPPPPPPFDDAALLGLDGESHCGEDDMLVPSEHGPPGPAAPLAAAFALAAAAANPGASSTSLLPADPLMRPWLCLRRKFLLATGMSHMTQNRNLFPDEEHSGWLHANTIPCGALGGMVR